MSDYEQLKERVFAANMELPRHGIVIFTFGNVSAIDREAGVVAIKPSGVPYEALKPTDIVVVDLQGKVVDGRLRPSSDTRTHLVLYEAFPGIGGIAHTHSTFAVAWAQAAQPIPLLGTTHADSLHLDIPCTEFMSAAAIAGDYETATGHQITAAFAALSPQEIEMVLVAGHGPFTWGATPEKAVQNSVILEELARMAYLTLQINPQTPRLPQALIDKHYQRKHGPQAYYGQSRK
ncbi:MAG TPA: L-ribulose-5-phosphate 4-epimerase [bacterium]|nr:L-ribulose-5-phosphate 4-epimerase [bacterium]HQI49059.1 L-ribulose-5-phosphate 4-epimerase [bacterium]HQJ65208.1 L-ribulose-5-phosphate 4-epimerase [bacterium]